MADDKSTWGTDGVVSLPQPMPTTDTAMVDMEGFCFTPNGLRVNISRVDHEELLGQGYSPALPEAPHG